MLLLTLIAAAAPPCLIIALRLLIRASHAVAFLRCPPPPLMIRVFRYAPYAATPDYIDAVSRRRHYATLIIQALRQYISLPEYADFLRYSHVFTIRCFAAMLMLAAALIAACRRRHLRHAAFDARVTKLRC